jgi:hypothetical protein
VRADAGEQQPRRYRFRHARQRLDRVGAPSRSSRSRASVLAFRTSSGKRWLHPPQSGFDRDWSQSGSAAASCEPACHVRASPSIHARESEFCADRRFS